MNKKVIFSGALLLLLVIVASGCKLPASGSPPTISSEVPVATATTGVAAEPTNTMLPPTQAIATATPLLPTTPPTAIPPTSIPPTAIPPTAIPTTTPPSLPPASRIQFPAGGTGATLQSVVDSGQTQYYVLKASASQTMSVKISSPNGDIYLGVFGADGTTLLSSSTKQTTWSGTLATTQDYYLSLTAGDGKESFTLSVDIPPVSAPPTANITPVPGTFDPVATYGQPTYSDPMTGANITDWTNPSTGLLPDTQFLKIAETDAKFYVTGKETSFSTWYFTWRSLTDFYLQSTFNSGSCANKDAYGLIIRGPEHLAGVSYGYVVSFSCDGSLWIFRIDSANPYTTKELVSWMPSSAIVAGANKQNVMGIKAIGSTLTVYANGTQIAQVTDSRYTTGRYGVFVNPDTTANYTYQVVNMAYWVLTP